MKPYEKLQKIAEIHADNYVASLELTATGTIDSRLTYLDGFYAALQLAGVKVRAEHPDQMPSQPGSPGEFTAGDFTVGMSIPHVYLPPVRIK